MNALGRLASYDLLARLGAGGMAETYVAIRRGPGDFEQRVCIKRVLPKLEHDAQFVTQFLEEARISAKLRHANVVQVLDFGVADGSHYLALELVDGLDLGKLLDVLEAKQTRLPIALVALLAHDLATALDYSHSHTSGAVFHRDVSPSNVLLSRAGEIKLSDFGIAKSVVSRSSTPNTVTGVVKGKVPYLAAEYALSGRFDARSDLFSLGVLLFECLAGRRPYVGVTDLDTVHQITSGRHPSLAELRPDAPAPLVTAVERLLRPDPDQRFESAAALLDALGEIAPPMSARRQLATCVRSAAPEPVLSPMPAGGTVEPAAAPALATPTAGDVDPLAATRTMHYAPQGERPADGAGSSSTQVPSDVSIATLTRGSVPRAALGLGLAAAVAIVIAITWSAGSPSSAPLDSIDDTQDARGELVAPDAAPPAALASQEDIVAPSAVIETPPSEPSVRIEAASEPPVIRTRQPRATRAAPARAETTPQREPAADARLRVAVAPWGFVWVDGRPLGRAPVELTLASGAHRVEAGFEQPLVSRAVTIAPGASERVFIDLPEPD